MRRLHFIGAIENRFIAKLYVIDQKEESKGTAVDTLLDLVTNCFPPNLVQATMQQYKTVIMDPGKKAVEDSSTGAMIYPDDLETWKMSSTWNNSTNILGLVIFSVVTGLAYHYHYH